MGQLGEGLGEWTVALTRCKERIVGRDKSCICSYRRQKLVRRIPSLITYAVSRITMVCIPGEAGAALRLVRLGGQMISAQSSLSD